MVDVFDRRDVQWWNHERLCLGTVSDYQNEPTSPEIYTSISGHSQNFWFRSSIGAYVHGIFSPSFLPPLFRNFSMPLNPTMVWGHCTLSQLDHGQSPIEACT